MNKISIALIVLISIMCLCSAAFSKRSTVEHIVSGNRIEVEEVKIDTCVYHAFYNCYSSKGGIFVIRVK